MTKNKCGYQMHIFVTSFSKQHAPVWRCFCMVQPLRQPFRPKCTNRILQMHQQNPVVPSESGVHPQNPVCTYSVKMGDSGTHSPRDWMPAHKPSELSSALWAVHGNTTLHYSDVSNHRRLDCLLNHLFRIRSKKTSKLLVTGLSEEWPVGSPHKGQVTRKMFPFEGVIMCIMEQVRYSVKHIKHLSICEWLIIPLLNAWAYSVHRRVCYHILYIIGFMSPYNIPYRKTI